MANATLRERYSRLVRKLFPQGWAWFRVNDSSSVIYKLLDSISIEYCRVEERGRDLLKEVFPDSTFELLEDWERLLALPDECDPNTAQSLQERRTRVIQVLTTRGGQNEQFYKDLAANFGFDVDVISAEDQPPFLAGISRAGDKLTNGDLWRYTFVITAPAEFLILFRAGQSTAGDRLVEVGNDTLECLMEKHKPAHTIVLFNFGDTEF